MKIAQRLARSLLALGLVLISPTIVAGTDHSNGGAFSKLAGPQPVEVKDRIEVIEFFWYGCPHCSKVEPFVEAWEKSLAPDVVFRREHVIWSARPDTEVHARLFATLRNLGIVSQHQRAVFDAIQRGRADFRDEKTLFDWAAKQGIDRVKFEAMYKSFGMQAQLARARAMTAAYRIEGVPTFVVNGKYSTEPHQAGGEPQMFKVIDRLIVEERSTGKR